MLCIKENKTNLLQNNVKKACNIMRSLGDILSTISIKCSQYNNRPTNISLVYVIFLQHYFVYKPDDYL